MMNFVIVSKAQKVQDNSNIIDCSNMLTSSVEDNMSQYRYQQQSGQLKRHLTYGGISGGPSVNDKVSKRFEVYSSDLPACDWATAMGFDPDDNSNINVGPTQYKNTGCSSLGADWRLPTYREMLLMNILSLKLKNPLSTNDYYWTSSEYDNNNSFYSNLDTGVPYPKNLTTKKVRCIKDLT